MEITQIKLRKIIGEGRLLAVVSVTFDGVFAVHDMKIVKGPDRLFVAMPSARLPDGSFRDVVHPIDKGFRRRTEEKVLEFYERAMREKGSQAG